MEHLKVCKMTLNFNDYALINGHPGGGGWVNHPWGHMWAWSTGFVDICCQFLAQEGGLDCFCNFIAESLRKRLQLGFVMHLAGMAGRENNEKSIENVVLSHSLTYKESSTSSLAVDKCRPRPDFELFLRPSKL